MKSKSRSWYKPKGYLHFSPKLAKADKSKVLEYIETKLESHNFFPLIHETLTVRRFKSYINENGEIFRSHFDSINSKPSKKTREIFYANHLDAHIYSYFANEILGKEYENDLKKDLLLSESIIAYRKIPIDENIKKNKCNIQFAKEVFDEILKRKNCVAVCYDIENFFPSLDHSYLKKCWQDLLRVDRLSDSQFKVYRSLTRYSYVEIEDVINSATHELIEINHKKDFQNSDFHSYFISSKDFREKIAKKNLIKINKPDKSTKKLRGIPQGTPISAFLANLYLLEFDKFIIENLVKKNDCFYRRYSDDIVILFNNMDQFKEWDSKVRGFISSDLLNLKIKEEKTIISQFSLNGNRINCITKTEHCRDYSDKHPMRYLGFEFNGEKILLKSTSLSKFYREMKVSISYKARKAILANRYNKKYPTRKAKDSKIHLTKIYSRFTHLGKNKAKGNYLTYVDRAAKIIYPDMRLNPIRNQIKRSWCIFNKSVKKYTFSGKSNYII